MLFPHVFASLFTTDAALLDFTARALRIYLAVMVPVSYTHLDVYKRQS